MKRWNTPAIAEISISETAHDWLGNSRDGGYIGDGVISGHLEWTKCERPNNPVIPGTPDVPPVEEQLSA